MYLWMEKLTRNLARQFNYLWQEVDTFPHDFRSLFNGEVSAILDRVGHLQGVPQKEFERIWPSLYDAARACVSAGWWHIFRKVLRVRKRLFALLVCLTGFITIGIALALPSLSFASKDEIASGVFLAPIYIFIRSMVRSRMHYRLVTISTLLEIALMITILKTFNRWSPQVDSLWIRTTRALVPASFEAKTHLATVHAAECLQVAIWLVTFWGIFSISQKTINSVGKWTTSGLEFGYGRATELNARLVVALFNISYYADLAASRLPNDRYMNTTDLSPIILHEKDRERINQALEGATRLIRRSWAETMASNNGVAGRWIAAQAPRIEFFLRYQQSKNILFSVNLTQLRDAMTTMAIQVIDGKWDLIGADHEDAIATLKARRWKSALRRILAFSLPSVAAFIVAKYMPHLPSPYRNLIIVTCIAYAGVQLLSLIDPDFSERVGLAGKVAASIVKRG
jgi:hypothetical protein